MLKANLLLHALQKDVNFIEAACLFNMCPVDQTDLIHDRFWPIELSDAALPAKRIGLMVWDNKKEKLHGPIAVKTRGSVLNANRSVLITKGNTVGAIVQPYPFQILDGYKFEKTEKGTEVYIYFTDPVNTDVCLSGFDEKELSLEEV